MKFVQSIKTYEELRDEVEANPRTTVVFRVKATPAHFRESVVILLSESAQVFLDAAEGRFDDLLSRQNQRLQASSHSAVAV